jgi:hypothetical protein
MAGEVEAAAIVNNNDADENEPYPEYLELDETVLRRMQSNDPSIASLCISDHTSVAMFSLEGVGRIIGDSTVLRRLRIYHHQSWEIRSGSGLQSRTGWYEELYRGIPRNRSIEVFNLYGAPSSQISELKPDSIFQPLIPFFKHNSNLRCIDVGCIRTTNAAVWRSFSSALSRPNKLKRLSVTESSLGDAAVISLAESVVKYSTLKSLYVNNNLYITLAGWQKISRSLRQSTTLEELGIEECGIDDDSASAIVNGLTGNSSLTEIGISDNPISTEWWESNFHILLSAVPSLEKLELTSLLREDLDEIDLEDMIDWTDLACTLCDSSSVDNIYSSNHTFRSMIILELEDHDEIDGLPPNEIASLLLMNSSENKHEVARAKILKYYFAEGSANNLHAFSHMPLTSMPFALEWIGRCGNELSLMYNVARQLPTLFEATSHESKCSGAKRGRSE